MFRHRGKSRRFEHNLRLAAFLSFTAGLVNICGLMALGVLTTNVTGHFAYFSAAVQKHDFLYALNFLWYILSFLSGAFVSSLLTEYFTGTGGSSPHRAAVFLETGILCTIGIWGDLLIEKGAYKELLSCLLLFAMGLQNALVTSISNATVRTTHLTGLFTDLGIELSQLFFFKGSSRNLRLKKSIGLRCSIIVFFFIGCILGGFIFGGFRLKTLFLAVAALLVALVYDHIRLGAYQVSKRFGRPEGVPK